MKFDRVSSQARGQLESLPTEIIRRVASNGPCSSALALLRTSRQLQAAVNDWTVFRAMIVGSQPDWNIDVLLESHDVHLWARYALANDKVIEFCNFPPEKKKVHRLLDWGPQLVVMHHPLLSYPTLRKLPDCHRGNSTDRELAFLFFRAACAMSYLLPSTLDLEETRKEFYANLLGKDLQVSEVMDELLCLETFPWYHENLDNRRPRYHNPRHDPGAALTRLLSTAYKGLPMFRYELLEAISEDRVRDPSYTSGVVSPPSLPNPLPPMTSHIPLFATMGLPTPFSKDAIGEVEEYGLATTLSREFITTGNWTGYGMVVARDGPRPVSVTFDSPICEVYFSVVKDGNDGLEFRSNECRSIGKSHDTRSLWLRCSRAGAGKFELVNGYKLFENVLVDWPMQAVVTPFGIVATRGGVDTQNAFNLANWLWLWKSEWTR